MTNAPGRDALVFCGAGVSVLPGTGMSGVLEARLVDRARSARVERPAQAPVAAAAAQVPAYALLAAKGAASRQKWTDGSSAFGATSAAELHHTIRASRGHEPWRDPA
ncbi:hypothetical protein [Streptomyces zingiberis]|nr:hypothetical protein [Streptomyces zingiberis]